MNCPHCGQLVELPAGLDPREAGCPSCGRPLVAETADASPEQASADEAALFRKLVEPITYYWSIRPALREQLRQWLRTLLLRRGPQREIRIKPSGVYKTAHRDEGAWIVRLPDSCVVCGEPPAGPRVVHDRQVDDITGPLLAPILALVLTAALTLLTGWPLWVLIVLPLGFFIGYLLRAKTAVRLQYKRCGDHHGVRSIPWVFAFGGSLVIRTGHWVVGEQFKELNGLSSNSAGRQLPISATKTYEADEPPGERMPIGSRPDRWRHSAAKLSTSVIQIVGTVVLLGVTPLIFKYATAQYGLPIGATISGSYVYLFIGGAVLIFCSQLLAGEPPDYAGAMFCVFLVIGVWAGVLLLVLLKPPIDFSGDMNDPQYAGKFIGLIAGVLILLIGLPAVIYSSVLEVSGGTATLIFIMQHILTLLIVGPVVWIMIRLLV